MKVSTVMSRRVHTAREHDSLEQAARIMWDHDCGYVPVIDDFGAIVGVVTDRDVAMAACLRDQRLAEISIASVMSKRVHTCGADDPVDVAERIMRREKVRRIPVEGRDGRLVGVVSLNDIARRSQTLRGRLTRALWPREVTKTLAAICEPRARSV